MTMRKTLGAALVALAAALPVGDALAQAANPRNTLVVLREIDADNYDPPRSTARSAGCRPSIARCWCSTTTPACP